MFYATFRVESGLARCNKYADSRKDFATRMLTSSQGSTACKAYPTFRRD
jgi:hypothetical protein